MLKRGAMMEALCGGLHVAERQPERPAPLPSAQGKPLAEASVEIHYGAGFIKRFAEEARRLYGYSGITLAAFYAGGFAAIVSGTSRGLSVSSITRSAREVDLRS
jgi:hypothetical protein